MTTALEDNETVYQNPEQDSQTNHDPLKRRYFMYGRRGRALGDDKQATIDALTQKYGFTLDDVPDLLKAPFKSIHLEIGFGSGDHLAHQASLNPDILFLGVEPFLNGYAGTLEKFHQKDLNNVRVWQGDARLLLDALPDHVLKCIYLLYPDPWPKKRHNHRRFVQMQTLDNLWRVLNPEGLFLLASDIPEYIRWSLTLIDEHAKFQWQAQSKANWQTPFDNWCSTKYERKAIREGRTPYYLTFTPTMVAK